ncbi:helix-turn-helix transcriptional regulator [Solwaraspora sp. WMMD791]|uniref:helix-turn-helix domain-containing protein n=1 Tax=Solwaraspora sp. WMMD791 TaxID=3016086 RepID=UPI00249A6427|nr:helix-turn-helix transcriptional regulator [Solwaraspora sp. WMMD791]WFE29273.1 helix-turn-helix transcriptional regulator [Solwaraspora sp. WMMD791]
MPQSRWPSPARTAVPSLTCRGRSPDADLIYRHLLGSGPALVSEVAGELGMARRRVGAALDELAAIGAVARRPSATSADPRWAARPLSALAPPVRRPTTNAAPGAVRPALARRLAATGVDVRQLGDGVRHLASRAATRARLAELVAVARHEHLAMHPEQTFDAEALRSAAPMDRTLLARGVRMRILGVQPPEPGPVVQHRSEPTRCLPEYRMAATLPVKLLVVDRKYAFFPVAPDDVERGYLEVAQPPIVAALVALFEQHWNDAERLQECTVPQIDLSPRERALVALLAQGHTDVTAARELRISPRSVSNVLRSLMERLGVTNRFQLGLALGAAHTAAPHRRTDTEEKHR